MEQLFRVFSFSGCRMREVSLSQKVSLWTKGSAKRGETLSKLGCVLKRNTIILTEDSNQSK